MKTPNPARTYDTARLRAAVEALELCLPDSRLLHMRTLCIAHGGLWPIPEGLEKFPPVLFEVSLHGVTALAQTAENLPRNWIRAARAILSAVEQEHAA